MAPLGLNTAVSKSQNGMVSAYVVKLLLLLMLTTIGLFGITTPNKPENLRQYAADLEQEISDDTQQQDITNDIIAQWQKANEIADEAELTLEEFIAKLEELNTQPSLLPEEKAQLETFKNLLPDLKEQLEIAQKAAAEAKATTLTEQAEYDSSSEAYQTALEDVLEQKIDLDINTQNLLQQIANTRIWVEQQSLVLDTEIAETTALKTQLQTELDTIPAETTDAEQITKKVQLQQSVNILTHKETILTAQQAAFTQKLTLLEAQKTVIETENQLLSATIESPDSDYSNLEDQLLDAQKTLAEVQKLAEQAEATSVCFNSFSGRFTGIFRRTKLPIFKGNSS